MVAPNPSGYGRLPRHLSAIEVLGWIWVHVGSKFLFFMGTFPPMRSTSLPVLVCIPGSEYTPI
jgi:hypothetical protein